MTTEFTKMAEKVVTVGELLKTLLPEILRFISHIFCFSSSYFWFQSCLYSSIYLCYAKCVQQLFMNGHGGQVFFSEAKPRGTLNMRESKQG